MCLHHYSLSIKHYKMFICALGVSRALSNENGSIKQDNDCLVSELAQNTKENEKHRAKITELEQENFDLKDRNKKLLHKSLHHPAQIKQLRDELTEKSCQLSSTCKERDTATADAENKLMMLSAHTTSYGKKLADVTEQLAKRTEYCEKLKEQLAQANELLASSHSVSKRLRTSTSESSDYRQPTNSAVKPCFTISSGSQSSKIPRRANSTVGYTSSGERQRRYSDPKSQFVKSASESEIKKTAS